MSTTRKMSKYGPEKTPYFNTFYAVFLFGNISVDDALNTLMLSITIDYLISIKRFDAYIFAQ